MEKIQQQQTEIEQMYREHQQRLEDTELVAQSKDEIARKFEIEKEEVKKYWQELRGSESKDIPGQTVQETSGSTEGSGEYFLFIQADYR